ncbi:MAG: InlB B-repeat-containing protein [Acholeplasmataceae bacterium]|jgi:hypothetical protein
MRKTNYLKKLISIIGIISLVLVGLLASKVRLKAEELITVTYVVNEEETFTTQIAPGTSAEDYDLSIYQGRKHVGWYENDQLTVPHQFGPLSANKTLYAKWTLITYTFNLNVEGMSNPIVVTGTVEDLLTKLETAKPHQEGHLFSGWHLENTLKNRVTNADDLLQALNKADNNHVVELYGKHIKQKYLAIFNFNGIIKYVWVTYGEPVIAPETPTVEGFALDSENPFSPALPEAMPASHQTFVANYVASQIAITFVNDNDEELVVVSTDYGKVPQYEEIPTSSLATLDATKYYYVFKGWNQTLVPAKEVKTYKATYNQYPYLYQLTVVVDGKPTQLLDVPYGTNLSTLLEDPQAPQGYLFDRWDGMPIDNLMPNSALTLTAEFKTDVDTQYRVRHMAENKEDENLFDIELFDDELKTGATGANTAAVAKLHDNYTAIDPVNVPIAADGSTVVIIKYQRNKYTISFNLDGGVETIDDQGVKYQHLVVKPTPNPTKPGYDFVEWQLNGNKYVFTTEVSSSFELTATWTPQGNTPYKVEHYQEKLDGSGYELVDTDNLQGETGNLTSAQEKVYAGFVSKPFNQVTIEPADTVVKIYYNRVSVPVHFNLNGGALVGLELIQVYKFGATIVEPTGTPTKDNYTFDKWVLRGTNTAYNFANAINQVNPILIDALYEVTTKSLTISGSGSDQVIVFVNDSVTPYDKLTDTVNYNDVLTIALEYDSTLYDATLKINETTITEIQTVFTHTVLADTTIEFDLERIKVTVTFDTKGGTPIIEPEPIDKGICVERPIDNPTKDHHTFSHWSATENGVAYDFAKPVLEDMTLFAVYIVDKHSIVYNETQNTVSITHNNNNVPSSSVVDYNTSVKIKPNTSINYEFIKFEIINNTNDELLQTVLPADLINGSYDYTVVSDIKILVYFKEVETPVNLVEVQFVVTEVPEGTTDVYLLGNFPHSTQGYYWEPTNGYLMDKNHDGTYSYTLQLPENHELEYKFHNGTEFEIYSDPDHNNNRNFIVGAVPITDDKITAWDVQGPQDGDPVNVQFVVTEVPEGTTNVYLLGNFPHETDGFYWDPINGYLMNKNYDGTYSIILELPHGHNLEYKFHNGTEYEDYSNNRYFTVGEVPVTDDKITGWVPVVVTYTVEFVVTLPEMPSGAVPYVIGVFPGLEPELPEGNTTANQWHNFTDDYKLVLDTQSGRYKLTITDVPNDYEIKYKIMYKLETETVIETHQAARTNTITDDIIITITDVAWPLKDGDPVQVTFTVNNAPGGTLKVNLLGNFPHDTPNYYWAPENGMTMDKNADGTFTKTLTLPYNMDITYKFHNGDKWEQGSDKYYKVGVDTEPNVSVTRWENSSTITFKLDTTGIPDGAKVYMIGVFPGLVWPGEGIAPTEPYHQWNNFTDDYLMEKQDNNYVLQVLGPNGYELKYKYYYTIDDGLTYVEQNEGEKQFTINNDWTHEETGITWPAP